MENAWAPHKSFLSPHPNQTTHKHIFFPKFSIHYISLLNKHTINVYVCEFSSENLNPAFAPSTPHKHLNLQSDHRSKGAQRWKFIILSQVSQHLCSLIFSATHLELTRSLRVSHAQTHRRPMNGVGSSGWIFIRFKLVLGLFQVVRKSAGFCQKLQDLARPDWISARFGWIYMRSQRISKRLGQSRRDLAGS